MKRREFLDNAVAFGATAVWCRRRAKPAGLERQERRDLFPEGVASGDPDENSVILWTRRPYADGRATATLRVEVATDEGFTHLVANDPVSIEAEADWTARVLVGGLAPSRVYWYRFVDPDGAMSRIGRTITAPKRTDARPLRFAFVSCQNANQGVQNAWRRMIYDDERAAPADGLGFVLHLGDFIYEIVWYPEDRARYFDRTVRDVVRYPTGKKIRDFHIPQSLEDYRAVYRAYLHDPDLQDARARWPFVPIWDNHEFSWLGWQGFQLFNGENIPAQTLKVAANQTWFEYQPARVAQPGNRAPTKFVAPKVTDAPIERFDADGLGQEPNNLAAIRSLQGYRTLRFGRHLDLVITDQRSYRSEEPTGRREAGGIANPDYFGWAPEEAYRILDAGRSYRNGRPPETIALGDGAVANFRRTEPPQTILGAEQRRWFLDRLAGSTATWKVWGNSLGTLESRVDPLNLPAGLTKPWTGTGYGMLSLGDFATAFVERGEIFDFVRDRGITGFAIVSGDRHAFWAGYAAKALPPERFEPVGVSFVTGSISAPGALEAYEATIPKDHPLRPCYLVDRPGRASPEPTANMLFRLGVRSCLEYAKTGDPAKARAVANPDLAPHLSFLDLGGHGFATVRVDGEALETEFVCIPRPLERQLPDGGPVRYRVRQRTPLWKRGQRPEMTQTVLEGDPGLSL
jgi:alkaline phosphatase D